MIRERRGVDQGGQGKWYDPQSRKHNANGTVDALSSTTNPSPGLGDDDDVFANLSLDDRKASTPLPRKRKDPTSHHVYTTLTSQQVHNRDVATPTPP